jgi:NO-binding membrane sensor protein with MHYT domain
MYRVFSCLTAEHDLRLVIFAGALCFLASLTAINLFNRARAAHGRSRTIWILTAGVAAGCGIWATHFIAMLAYEPGFATAYNIGLTVLSLLAAVAVTTVGLGVAVRGQVRWNAPFGGGIVGGGIACMHFLGMSALELPGHLTWSPDLVVVSVVIGIVFGAGAMTVAVRREGARAMLLAAVLLTLAILSHHFTAMGAIEIVADPTRIIHALSLAPTTLALAIAGVTVVMLAISLVGMIVDERFRDQSMRLDAALNNMHQGLLMPTRRTGSSSSINVTFKCTACRRKW